MILLPSKPKVTEKKDHRAVFEIEGLHPGYGVTIGNSLRRVLLSSLEGAAVTQMKIEGVQHEFSTIDGVLEDVVTIMLNVKKLRFKIHSDEPQIATLRVKGEKEVTGADLKVPTQLELVNKELHIATLTDKKAGLSMDIRVEKGIGFVIADQEKREKLEVGQISIDSIFTPVRGVNFKVENMRVGKRTDFERLFLEIETDGTISPENAFKKASQILIDHFSILTEEKKIIAEPVGDSPEERVTEEKVTEEKVTEEKVTEEKATEEKATEEEVADVGKTKIEEMNISSRTANILVKNNIKTAAGLARRTEESLLTLEGMGDKGIQEIKKGLKKLGLELK